MENRGEGCPHVLTSAWRVAGAGRLHEDYTLRARFENRILALSSKTPWHISIGVLLGLAAWRCVDQMLIVTKKSERASVTRVRKEIRRNAVSLV